MPCLWVCFCTHGFESEIQTPTTSLAPARSSRRRVVDSMTCKIEYPPWTRAPTYPGLWSLPPFSIDLGSWSALGCEGGSFTWSSRKKLTTSCNCRCLFTFNASTWRSREQQRSEQARLTCFTSYHTRVYPVSPVYPVRCHRYSGK